MGVGEATGKARGAPTGKPQRIHEENTVTFLPDKGPTPSCHINGKIPGTLCSSGFCHFSEVQGLANTWTWTLFYLRCHTFPLWHVSDLCLNLWAARFLWTPWCVIGVHDFLLVERHGALNLKDVAVFLGHTSQRLRDVASCFFPLLSLTTCTPPPLRVRLPMDQCGSGTHLMGCIALSRSAVRGSKWNSVNGPFWSLNS